MVPLYTYCSSEGITVSEGNISTCTVAYIYIYCSEGITVSEGNIIYTVQKASLSRKETFQLAQWSDFILIIGHMHADNIFCNLQWNSKMMDMSVHNLEQYILVTSQYQYILDVPGTNTVCIEISMYGGCVYS